MELPKKQLKLKYGSDIHRNLDDIVKYKLRVVSY